MDDSFVNKKMSNYKSFQPISVWPSRPDTTGQWIPTHTCGFIRGWYWRGISSACTGLLIWSSSPWISLMVLWFWLMSLSRRFSLPSNTSNDCNHNQNLYYNFIWSILFSRIILNTYIISYDAVVHTLSISICS